MHWNDNTVVAGQLRYRDYTNVYIPLNVPVTVHCYARHNETEWLHGNKVVVSSGELQDNVTDRFNYSCSYPQDHGWCNLTILSAKIEDSGTYECNSYYFKHTYYTRVTVFGRIHVKNQFCHMVFYVVLLLLLLLLLLLYLLGLRILWRVLLYFLSLSGARFAWPRKWGS